MGLDLVIFDCDGVLIDSEMLSVAADIACLGEYGIDMPAEALLERYTGISLAGMPADIETRHGRTLPDFAARHQRHLRRLFEASLRPIPGIEAVLDALPCQCCVASSGTPERLRHALSLVGLYERLQPHIFSTTEVANGKPAPDLFLHAAARMGVRPGGCIVVEDSLPGIDAAVAAGMTALGFTGGSHCGLQHGQRMRDRGATVVIGAMVEFIPALTRLGSRAV